jgi:hypothetical protein
MTNHYNLYKIFKKKIINKYNKQTKTKISRTINNLDKFVSINEFLAEEMSKGPIEEKGSINYFYQSYVNIFNFFTILTKYYNFNEILCIPKFVIKYKNYIEFSSIAYYIDTKELIIPVKLQHKITKCMNTKIRFIYCTIIIGYYHNDNNISHANILIIDLHKQTIERFEPHGRIVYGEAKEHDINQTIKKNIYLQNFTYLSPFEISPIIGLQRKADAHNGMCVTFCMLYLQLRLMNPDMIQKELIMYLLKKNKNELVKLILKYAKFVEITLKKYDFVVQQNEKYIEKKWYSKQKFVIYKENNERHVEFGL